MTKIRVAVILAVLLSAGGTGGCSTNATTPLGPPTQPITVYQAGVNGVSVPTVSKQVNPHYTAEAIGNRIQGTVLLAVVVLPNGTVGDVTVLQSLDTIFGLDAEAVIAAKQWVFNPAMKDGLPVAVRVTIEMSFTLR